MSREIHCVKCGKYLGEIRDAKLRKNIHFICDDCNTRRLALELKETIGGGNTGYDPMDVMKDIFGGR